MGIVDTVFPYLMGFLFAAWIVAEVGEYLRRARFRHAAINWDKRAAELRAHGAPLAAELAEAFAQDELARATPWTERPENQ